MQDEVFKVKHDGFHGSKFSAETKTSEGRLSLRFNLWKSPQHGNMLRIEGDFYKIGSSMAAKIPIVELPFERKKNIQITKQVSEAVNKWYAENGEWYKGKLRRGKEA